MRARRRLWIIIEEEKIEQEKWASLPNDLLASIFDKSVCTLSDCIRFSSVCKSWKSFAMSHKEKHMQLTNHQLPYLMISFWNSEKDERQQSLYSFIDHRISNFCLRIPNKYKHSKCYGSSHGWLIFLYKNKSFRLVVLNPFSGAVIHLPPMENSTSTTSSNKHIDKVILSRDPSHGSFEFYKDRILCGSRGRILSLNVVDSIDEYSSPIIEVIEEVDPPVSDIESEVYKIEEFNLEDQSFSSVQVDQRFALHLESDCEYYSWILPSMSNCLEL
ncbi:hypothetical protein FNV43_RR02157 [Rhamnella rubrinervis]|uniref:F-box domain-containing protein n=1 Tax=Rhamnella rubrinervis TaxID=2594499 RepID=A0A8K0HTF2_9ROSA|nr:hypothetical protein FNV43_RR02157 [Rhamnella rubrinervis]